MSVTHPPPDPVIAAILVGVAQEFVVSIRAGDRPARPEATEVGSIVIVQDVTDINERATRPRIVDVGVGSEGEVFRRSRPGRSPGACDPRKLRTRERAESRRSMSLRPTTPRTIYSQENPV